jgi:hypothetical protein
VCFSRTLEGQWRADRYRESTVPGRGVEIRHRLPPGGSQKSSLPRSRMVMLSNSTGQPERETGAVLMAGVRGDDRVILGDGSVEVNVVGECDIDDAVNALARVDPDGRGRVGLVEGDAW